MKTLIAAGRISNRRVILRTPRSPMHRNPDYDPTPGMVFVTDADLYRKEVSDVRDGMVYARNVYAEARDARTAVTVTPIEDWRRAAIVISRP